MKSKISDNVYIPGLLHLHVQNCRKHVQILKKTGFYLAVFLLIAILSIAYAVEYIVTIPSTGEITYPPVNGEWQYESLGLNFLASDVIPGGTTVIAGARYSGAIWRSTEEGAPGTWTHVADLNGITEVWMVYYSPHWNCWFASGDYGGGAGGLFRSVDDGLTWNREWYHSHGTMVHLSGICEDESGVLYIGSYNTDYLSDPSVYKSADGGDTWTLVYTFGEGHIHCLRYNSATQKMWAFVGDPGHAGYGLYWASSPFDSWTRTSFIEGHMEDVTEGYPMSFECFGTYLYFSIHWDEAKCIRADFSDPPISNPFAEILWQGGFDRLNWVRQYKNWLLVSGEAHAGQPQMKIGGSNSSPFAPGTWEDIYVDGRSQDDGGCAVASHHWSLNGWFFVANTITGQGIRIRYT